ncbi:glycoside hydrolase family 5 protein [Athelia psychrophila]|uniref:glucan 1,3-beta-glucosidase n=1 Tax=Athelia psychrophila TaxID=1759441 RepID=A0A165XZD0_9AGAM|nr:glycoside hydrolase family 5 protein [Fibularhizoctonia sp. CBS 109695]
MFLQEPRQSEVQLQWRGEGGGADAQPAAVARHPSDELPTTSKKRSLHKRPICWFILIGLIIVIIAVVVPICVLVVKKHPAAAQAAQAGGNSSTNAGSITGGDGSTIYVDGSPSFVYSNSFGGTWYYDPEDPFNNNAQANSWTPPLSTPWDYGKHRINGVNLGGLFVLEPITTPFLFQTYAGSVDEWTLSTTMMATDGNLSQIENHYNTFITEQDIAEIAGAGLNWIRLPIPYWAIETWAGEPFLEKVSWQYIIRVLQWARKYGLRVNLDLNTIPGSQNGLNHSGKLGSINFMYGVMGVANAQRALDYIRIITEFISQPEWTNVVPMFSVINEPEQIQHIGNSQMYSFYLKVHDMIRGITGIGKGPFIVISDGFSGVGSNTQWNSSILNGADRIAVDTHLYYAFSTGPQSFPDPRAPCTDWAANMNTSKTAFGVTIAGEFTAGFNACGLYVLGVNDPANATLNCDLWSDHTQWNSTVISAILDFTLGSMDAAQDYFFRTWKIGNSTAERVQSPLWSYQLGLQNGWIPKDPRQAISHCANQGAGGSFPFNGQFQPWQTGGVGAGVIASTFIAQYGQWPPNLNGGLSTPEAASLLPMYTSTGTVATLPPPTLTASVTHSISVGDGWYDSSDTIGGVTAAAGCAYPNAWSAVSIAIPTVCKATPVAAAAYITSPPTPR